MRHRRTKLFLEDARLDAVVDCCAPGAASAMFLFSLLAHDPASASTTLVHIPVLHLQLPVTVFKVRASEQHLQELLLLGIIFSVASFEFAYRKPCCLDGIRRLLDSAEPAYLSLAWMRHHYSQIVPMQKLTSTQRMSGGHIALALSEQNSY